MRHRKLCKEKSKLPSSLDAATNVEREKGDEEKVIGSSYNYR